MQPFLILVLAGYATFVIGLGAYWLIDFIADARGRRPGPYPVQMESSEPDEKGLSSKG